MTSFVLRRGGRGQSPRPMEPTPRQRCNTDTRGHPRNCFAIKKDCKQVLIHFECQIWTWKFEVEPTHLRSRHLIGSCQISTRRLDTLINFATLGNDRKASRLFAERMPWAILPVSCITSSDYHCLSDSLSHMRLPSRSGSRSEYENDFRIDGGRADSCLDLKSDADPGHVGSLSSTPDLCGRTKLLHPRLRANKLLCSVG